MPCGWLLITPIAFWMVAANSQSPLVGCCYSWRLLNGCGCFLQSWSIDGISWRLLGNNTTLYTPKTHALPCTGGEGRGISPIHTPCAHCTRTAYGTPLPDKPKIRSCVDYSHKERRKTLTAVCKTAVHGDHVICQSSVFYFCLNQFCTTGHGHYTTTHGHAHDGDHFANVVLS